MSGGRQRLLPNLLLALGAMILAIVLMEVAVRLLGFDWQVDHNWRYHPRLGWTQVPDARYEVTMNGLDVVVAFNGDGFRDDAHALEPDPGVKRVVVLGDSFSEAIQVPLELTWHQRLEALLGADGEWEVINLGVGDFGTAQQWLLLERALAYRPDVLIHQVFPLNDVCNNNVALAGQCKSLNDAYRPYFALDEQGDLAPVHRLGLRRWLRENVLLWFLGERAVRSLTARLIDDSYWARRAQAAGYTPLDPLLLTFAPEAATRYPEIEAGWRVTEALLRRVATEAGAAGVPYLGFVIPFEARVGVNWQRFSRNPAWRDGPLAMDVAYPERRLGALYDELGVPWLSLRPALEAAFETAMPYWGGHLSPGGHEVAARALVQPVRTAVSDRRPGDDG